MAKPWLRHGYAMATIREYIQTRQKMLKNAVKIGDNYSAKSKPVKNTYKLQCKIETRRKIPTNYSEKSKPVAKIDIYIHIKSIEIQGKYL